MMIFFLTAMVYVIATTSSLSYPTLLQGPQFPDLETYFGSLILKYDEVQLRIMNPVDSSSSRLADNVSYKFPSTIIISGKFIDIESPKGSIIYQVRKRKVFDGDGYQSMLLTANREKTGNILARDVWFYLKEKNDIVTLIVMFGGLEYIEYVIVDWEAVKETIKKA